MVPSVPSTGDSQAKQIANGRVDQARDQARAHIAAEDRHSPPTRLEDVTNRIPGKLQPPRGGRAKMVQDSMGLYFSFITPSIHKFCPLVRPRKKVHTFASPYGPESGSLRVLEFLWFTFATFCRPNVQTRRTVRLATAERYIALRCFPPISFVLLFHRRRWSAQLCPAFFPGPANITAVRAATAEMNVAKWSGETAATTRGILSCVPGTQMPPLRYPYGREIGY